LGCVIVCFDIGGSAIKAAVADSATRMRVLPKVPTPVDDFNAFVAALAGVIAASGAAPERVALSIAGVLDPDTGVATVANIPCLTGRPLVRDLEAALGLPVLVANDADCFALAEATVGAGAGHAIVFGAILGSGVGGGVVTGGRLINAAGGYAGEWGHGPVAARVVPGLDQPLPAFPCGCGLTGCLDAICSARGIEKLWRHLGGEARPSTEILALWHEGEARARRVVEVYLHLISGPLAMVVNLTGASIVPVGGGLANDTALIAAIDAATRPLTLRRFGRPLVVPATCGPDAGLTGAAILALQAD
jgi:N-acetylglucosamine kinase